MPNELISHSEVEAFSQCEKKHEYAHIQKIQPKKSSLALDRGNAGHLMFEVFFKSLKEGMPTEEAKRLALMNPELMRLYPMVAVGEAMGWVTYWIDNVWPTLGWKVVAVEQKYEIQVGEGLKYPFKFDLLVEFKGELVLVDHKFTYDAYSEDVCRLLPQMPRYAGAMRKLGIDVRYGIYNFIRTRSLKDPAARFHQQPVKFGDTRIKNSIMELVQEMKAIKQLEDTPVASRRLSIRTANKMNCDHCGFKELCARELEGQDTTILRKLEFEDNSYGYTEESE
jgi:CRISPR/Cas system-associated exonuclease Cas4 (RecB family)